MWNVFLMVSDSIRLKCLPDARRDQIALAVR